jgi:hypothetical protein
MKKVERTHVRCYEALGKPSFAETIVHWGHEPNEDAVSVENDLVGTEKTGGVLPNAATRDFVMARHPADGLDWMAEIDGGAGCWLPGGNRVALR